MLNLYHDSSRNLLVYKTDAPALILNHVGQSRAVNGNHVAVPINLFNLQLCRRLNLPVVPVMTDYDWPIERGRKPLAHQKLMANFMVLNPYCFNLSDMGTMKTLSTLWACDWLMRQSKEPCRVLIVAPLSILQRAWGDSIFANFLGRRTFKVLHGSPKTRLRLLAEEADFYIVNYDGLGVGASTQGKFKLDGFSKALADRTDIRICVIDEAGAYRDSRTTRHRITRVLCKRDYLWLLTGTPTPNAPTDAFGLAKLVNNAHGENFGSFQARTMVKLWSSQFKLVPARGGYQEARKLLTPAIRFDIKDVWDGPELTTQQRQVQLTPNQTDLLRKMKNQLSVELQSGVKITPVNEAAVRTKSLQIILGAVYDDAHDAHATDAKSRLKELDHVIENAAGKILILAPFTSVVHLIYKHLRVTREMVTGATTANERNRIFSSFQNEADPRVIVADPGCLAHGLDLWRAQTVVWYGTTDKTELYLQANKRAHRPGQKYPVTIVQLVATALEREIFKRLESQERQQGLMLDWVRLGREL